MKKVRLFAVAAAMGMFASTVTAAETTTGYVSTWGSVDEIIKVDVGDKVVAPTATIKVVKETRTTDIEDALDSDYLGLDVDVECYVGNTDVIGEDEDENGYTDDQVYFLRDTNTASKHEPGYYETVEDAVNALARRGMFLQPGAAEVEEGTYATLWSDTTFADYEEVLAYAVEKGFVEYEYDEDGEVTAFILNKTEVTNEDGKVYATAALKVTLEESKYAEEEASKAVVEALVSGSDYLRTNAGKYWTVSNIVKSNYAEKGITLGYRLVEEDVEDTVTTLELSTTGKNILVVEEDRYGDLIPVRVSDSTNANIAKAFIGGNGKAIEFANDKITVLVVEEADKDFEDLYNSEVYYNVLMSVKPATSTKWAPVSEMVWDIEAGAFVKEEVGYEEVANVSIDGFWWNHVVDHDDDDEEVEATFDSVDFNGGILGLFELPEAPENDSDKIVIFNNGYEVTGINTKTNKMTVEYADDKELTVDAVKLDGTWYPAVSTKAELVKVVAKLEEINGFGSDKFNELTENYLDYLAGDAEKPNKLYAYEKWYEATKNLAKNPWSGFTFEGELPISETNGADAKACTYKVADGEEVEATISSDADSVDTSVAGVKTLTLTAKVGEEVVSTKEVKVVVAPKYERTYVNGKVSVLKAFHLNGNLYAEYHYDWAAKTYSATFYQQDGVTVGSTANGTL